jgi:hypothetical protein
MKKPDEGTTRTSGSGCQSQGYIILRERLVAFD